MAVFQRDENTEAAEQTGNKVVDLNRELSRKTALLLVAGAVILAFLLSSLVLWALLGRNTANGSMKQGSGIAEPKQGIPSATLASTDSVEEETNLFLNAAFPLLMVQLEDRWGYVTPSGELVIEALFEEASPFREGLAAVRINGFVGYINYTGDWIIPAEFDEGMSFFEDRAAVKTEQGWGFVNREGRLMVEPKYDSVRHFSEERAAVFTEGKWGYMDPAGHWVVYPRFENAWSFDEGIAQVETGGLIGYIDRQGEWIWDPRFRQ